MTPKLDPAAALDARDTELLRDLRSRLNRLPPSAAARNVLAGAVFKACARVGLVDGATGSLAELSSAVAALMALRSERPDDFAKAVASGSLQTVLTRRLVLAGREGVELA